VRLARDDRDDVAEERETPRSVLDELAAIGDQVAVADIAAVLEPLSGKLPRLRRHWAAATLVNS
jgi:hypothetical protein